MARNGNKKVQSSESRTRSVRGTKPPRFIIQSATASEILKTFGITDKQFLAVRRELANLGLL